MRFSQASKDREELFPVNADMEVVDAEEVERMGKTMEETNKCIFCGFEAPVALRCTPEQCGRSVASKLKAQ